MFKIRLHQLLAGLAGFVLLGGFEFPLFAQASECPPPAVLLLPSDSVYADAMELKQTLESHGFVVRCIFPTKFGSIFQVKDGDVLRSTIEGEADFSTNYGNIDAVFLPKPQTFADFKITAHREGGGYVYTFAGSPRVWDANRFSSASRIYFLKHGNQMLMVGEKLRRRVERALQFQVDETPQR
jgi:hypothetical protein